AYDEFGRVTSLGGQSGSSGFLYDDLNRLVSYTPAVGGAVSYDYVKDPALHRWISHVTLAGAGTWEYRADPKGRLAQLLNPFGQLTTTSFDPDGKPVQQVKANGTTTLYAWTPRDWLASIQHNLANGQTLD